MKSKQLAFRVDEDTYNWLADQAVESQKTMSEVVRDIFEVTKMSEDTRGVYGKCLDYLSALDSTEFLQGLDGLMSILRGVKPNR
ncbi:MULTISPECIES: hypothetical protein [Nostoc]|uniref:CopG family transcriptional regulator n=1 Tax=Nostoc paludosum FACHB-159 TaxID=2692908 RepID=A0ABR8KNF8_9NOSO|nr:MULTISPECIES: hypothetical protein [Nostoc]MBD2683233.1 hypothetical protein [Nostoc sp. FACHB-857]MBD2739560.1 hypothetical protein [Nostoc paludosum FACHB-159]